MAGLSEPSLCRALPDVAVPLRRTDHPLWHRGCQQHRLPGRCLARRADRPDEASVRRLIARLADPGRLRACYEVGPTGYELGHQLHRMGVAIR